MSRLTLPGSATGTGGRIVGQTAINEGDESSVLIQDAWTVLHDGWAPHEFVNLGGSNNIPAPPASLPPLIVSETLKRKPPESCIAERKFETLHHLFCPHRVTPLDEENDSVEKEEGETCDLEKGKCSQGVCRTEVLQRPHTRISCTNQNTGHDGGTGRGLAKKVVGALDVFQLTAARRAAASVENAAMTERSFTLKTLVDKRVIVVERAQSHFFLLFEAIAEVFPEIICPCVSHPEEICDLHIDSLLSIVSHHSSKLSTFLPLLYFLFETNMKQFALYYSRLHDQYENQQRNEAALFGSSRRTATSVLFGWIPGQKKDQRTSPTSEGYGQGGGVSDAEVIAENLEALPERYIVHYSIVKEIRASCEEASMTCDRLYNALLEETEALQNVIDVVGTLDNSFFGEGEHARSVSESFAEWTVLETVGNALHRGDDESNTTGSAAREGTTGSSDNLLRTVQTEGMDIASASLRKATTYVHQYLGAASAHQANGALPIVKTMAISMQMALYCAIDTEQHAVRPLKVLKLLGDREKRLLNEQKRQSHHTDPTLVGMVEAVMRQRQCIANFRVGFVVERERSNTRWLDSLRSVCLYATAMASHLAEGYLTDVASLSPLLKNKQEQEGEAEQQEDPQSEEMFPSLCDVQPSVAEEEIVQHAVLKLLSRV